MTARNTWKGFERRVAKAVGGRRIPVTGIDRDGCDVDAGPFQYQVKLRARASVNEIRAWLSGICARAGQHEGLCAEGAWLPGDQKAPCDCRGLATGVVVLKELGRGRLDEDALVIVRFKDWVALHGK